MAHRLKIAAVKWKGNPGKENSIFRVTKGSVAVSLGSQVGAGGLSQAVLLKALTAVVKEHVCLFGFLKFPICQDQYFYKIQLQ